MRYTFFFLENGKDAKTYDRRDSKMVTHSNTTSHPFQCLRKGHPYVWQSGQDTRFSLRLLLELTARDILSGIPQSLPCGMLPRSPTKGDLECRDLQWSHCSLRYNIGLSSAPAEDYV